MKKILVVLSVLMGLAMAQVQVNVQRQGFVFEREVLVVGALPSLRVVNVEGSAVVYAAPRATVVRSYELEFARVGWVRMSKRDWPNRDVYVFRGPLGKTTRVVFYDHSQSTKVLFY